jgi:RNA 3'-terminal phosphate cyclase (ATP)
VSLLFQSLLLPLILAGAASRLTLIGGTHVPWSPSVHYLTRVFLPALRSGGIEASLELRRWGWYPAGGGEIEARIAPALAVESFAPEPSPAMRISGLSAVSRLPRSIAERQRDRVMERLVARPGS